MCMMNDGPCVVYNITARWHRSCECLRGRNSPYLAEQLWVELFELVVETLIGLFKTPLFPVLVTVRHAVRGCTAVAAASAQDATYCKI